MSFGTELRQERESRDVSLAQIAEATKVSERHLRALEADNYADLPGGVFNRGIVRSTCHYLRLDPDAWTARFTAHHADQTAERDWKSFAENVKATRPPATDTAARWWGLALLLLALFAITWAAWHFLLHPHIAHRHPVAPVATAMPVVCSSPSS